MLGMGYEGPQRHKGGDEHMTLNIFLEHNLLDLMIHFPN